MGAACTSGISAFTSRSVLAPVKILILGKQNSGKTFMLYSWKYGIDYILSIEPTSHFNVDTITSQSGKKFLMYDLAGNIGYRIRPFLGGTNGVIYMLGVSGDDFLLSGEQEMIMQIIHERDLENIPVLFVIRRDKDAQESSPDLPENLLASLDGRVWELLEVRSHCQEDANLVLSVLEKLLTQSKVFEAN
ncbi:uncharacterized protein LOC131940791 [Physella acuta]|uniref:uncharacterized protein LOC131940791 n=1 Tax=Physella acuta TaxID=109671 RepID=UPI0027DCD4A8|nr:uncharacterized protein LOC131940791 [Physella acuta]